MRAGELRHRAEIVELNPNLVPTVVGGAWVGVIAKEAADVPMPSGLRNPAKIDIRARFSSKITAGRYLRVGQRLLHITSVRDPLGNKAELRISADELIGQAAVLVPEVGEQRPCRVFLQYAAPVLDAMGQVVDYKTRAELALIEAGRAQPGDALHVGGLGYQVVDYDDSSDDGVVRGVWLERVP